MSCPCPIHLGRADPMGLSVFSQCKQLLLNQTVSETSDTFHLTIQRLLYLTGVDPDDLLSRGPDVSRVAPVVQLSASMSNPSVVCMEVEEAVDRLEMLTARLVGLQLELQHEVDSLVQQQIDGCSTILEGFRGSLASLQFDLSNIQCVGCLVLDGGVPMLLIHGLCWCVCIVCKQEARNKVTC